MRRAYPYAWLEQETVCGLEMILHTHCSLFVCCLYMCMSHAERVALRIIVACATEGPGHVVRPLSNLVFWLLICSVRAQVQRKFSVGPLLLNYGWALCRRVRIPLLQHTIYPDYGYGYGFKLGLHRSPTSLPLCSSGAVLRSRSAVPRCLVG